MVKPIPRPIKNEQTFNIPMNLHINYEMFLMLKALKEAKNLSYSESLRRGLVMFFDAESKKEQEKEKNNNHGEALA